MAPSERERRDRDAIARRAVAELRAGEVVNIGVGIPAMMNQFLPEGLDVFLHSENGIIGMGPAPAPDEEDPDLTNAGAQPITAVAGASFFDIVTSASMMRGGHLDKVFMGAYQVDVQGNLANWRISTTDIKGGIGGAMDLAVGARQLIVLMTHVTKEGRSRVVERCDMPLTAMGVVDRIITDYAVIDVSSSGLVLRELMGEHTLEDVLACTDAELTVDIEAST